MIVTKFRKAAANLFDAIAQAVGPMIIFLCLIAICLNGRVTGNITSFVGFIEAVGIGSVISYIIAAGMLAFVGTIAYVTLTTDVDERGWH